MIYFRELVKMRTTLIMWAVLVHNVVTIVSAEPVNFNPEWASRRLLNATIEPEKSVFEKIKAFYDDPNNLAMYGVLPSIVLVYGGFCVIYCACKGYNDCKKKKLKEEKKKRLIDDNDDDVVTANSSGENNNITKKPDQSELRDNTDKKPDHIDLRNHPDPRSVTRAAAAINMKPNGTPAKPSTTTSTSDVKLAVERESTTPLPWAIPENDDLYPNKSKEKSHSPPPQAIEAKPVITPYKTPNRKPHPDMHMPPSPPPPYDDYERRDSVEEISMNPRKLQIVSNKANGPRKAMNAMNAMEQYALARQAAQMLRIDNGQPGHPGQKKPKRLVFVAE